MNAPWHIDRLLRPRAGQDGHLQIVDDGDGPNGRVVCVIPGHLVSPSDVCDGRHRHGAGELVATLGFVPVFEIEP